MADSETLRHIQGIVRNLGGWRRMREKLKARGKKGAWTQGQGDEER